MPVTARRVNAIRTDAPTRIDDCRLTRRPELETFETLAVTGSGRSGEMNRTSVGVHCRLGSPLTRREILLVVAALTESKVPIRLWPVGGSPDGLWAVVALRGAIAFRAAGPFPRR